MIAAIIRPNLATVFSDTVSRKSGSNVPHNFVSRVATLPHAKCVLFSTGTFDAGWNLYRYVQSSTIAQDIDYLHTIAQSVLYGWHRDVVDRYGVEPSKSMYLCGVETRSGRIVCYRFASEADYEPKRIENGVVVSPDEPKLNEAFKDVGSVEKQLSSDLDNRFATLENCDGVDIGGDIVRLDLAVTGAIAIRVVHTCSSKQNDFDSMLTVSEGFGSEDGEKATIYFDKNIWSNLNDTYRNRGIEPIRGLIETIWEANCTVVYSTENVRECIRRKERKAEAIDLWLMDMFSGGRQIDEHGNATNKKPMRLAAELRQTADVSVKVAEQFQKCASILSTTDSTHSTEAVLSSSGFDSNVLNNLSPSRAIETVFGLFIDSVRHVSASTTENTVTAEQIEQFCLCTEEVIRTALIEEGGDDLPASFVDILVKEFGASVRTTLVQSLKVDARTAVSGSSSFSDMFAKLGIDRRTLPGVVQGMLHGLRYWPDKATTLRRKGTDIDGSDMNHVNFAFNCDVFVVDDRRLRMRTKATAVEMGSDIIVLGYDEFIEWLELRKANSA